MKSLRNLSISSKLGLSFGLCLSLSFAAGLISLSGMGKSQATADSFSEKLVPRTADLAVIRQSILEYRLWQMRFAAQTDPAAVKAAPKKMSEYAEKVDKSLDDYGSKCTSPAEKATATSLADGWHHFVSSSSSRAKEIASSPKVGVPIIEKGLRPIYKNEIEPLVAKIIAENDGAAKKQAAASRATSNGARASVIAVLVLSLLIGSAAAWIVSSGITRSVRRLSERFESLTNRCMKELSTGLEHLAEGNLAHSVEVTTEPVPIESMDEIGRMAQTFNKMLERIREAVASYRRSQEGLGSLVTEVRSAASRVDETSTSLAATAAETKAASTEIAEGSDRLAQAAKGAEEVTEEMTTAVANVSLRTEMQNRSLGDAVSRLDGTVQSVTEVARSAQTMTTMAKEGGHWVEETASAMELVRQKVADATDNVRALDSKGQQIGSIVETIEGIAEQTNLLALNAAIEAARAGTHGRGFAVVADEVRKLAEKASVATKEISGLIEEVRSMVGRTVIGIDSAREEAETAFSRSHQAAEVLAKIVEASHDVSSLTDQVSHDATAISETMSEVSEAAGGIGILAGEMSQGASRVRESIGHVASVSHQSAAGAEELTASVEDVSSAAYRLSSMSRELREYLARFQVQESTEQAPPVRLAA